MKLIVLFVLGLMTTGVFAAKQGVSGRGNWSLEKTLDVLKMPVFNRQLLFKRLDDQALSQLNKIVFTDSYDMSIRWRALTTIAVHGDRRKIGIIQRASVHPQWFIRNAALVGASHTSKKMALKLARELRDDEAMVVRAAAVEVLASHGSKVEIDSLWKELDAKRNYRKGQSLWIRAKIAKALSRVTGKGQMHRIIPWLKEDDNAMQSAGVNAMQKLTGIILGKPGDSNKARAKYWLSWWGTRASL